MLYKDMKKLKKSLALFPMIYNLDLKMKLTICLLFNMLFQIQASEVPKAENISLYVANVSVDKVLKEIEKQSDYKFLYNNREVNHKRLLTGSYTDKSVPFVLTKIFYGTPIVFDIEGTQIILRSNSLKRLDDDLPILTMNLYDKPQTTITGTITDSEGISIPGVSVLEKNTTNGVAADFDGNYSIKIPGVGRVLVFSSIGFTTQEITVGQSSIINVTLVEDTQSLDEVVVTALGIKRDKKALTYAVSEVNGDDLNKAREINVGNALSGRVAGVTASSTTGGPASSSRVIIRGNGSLNGDNQPLYVVNGMPITNSNPSSPGTYGGIDKGDGLSSINPDDIESISVLKGGTAAALYGARAANGVVIITTKSGTSRKGIGIEYHTNLTMEQPINLLDWQYEYGSGSQGNAPTSQQEAVAFGRTSWGARLDGSQVVQADGQLRPYSAQKKNVENFYRTGSTISNSVAISGGNETVNFRFGVSNMDNEAIVPNTGLNRKTFNLNINANLSEKVVFAGNAQYTIEDVENRPYLADFQRNPNAGTQLIASNVDVRILDPGYLENGNEMPWSDYIYATNPYFAINKYTNGDTRKRFIGSFSTTYNFTDYLYARARIGIDQIDSNGFEIIPTGTAFSATGSMVTDQSQQTETNVEAVLGFSKDIGRFSVNILAGGNQMRNTIDGVNLSSGNFTIPFQYFIGNGSSQSFAINYGEYGINSLFTSVDIDFSNYLYATFTGRNDWFSTLSTDNNNLFYPSVGLSFLVSEAWQNKPTWLSYAKLRTSWAQVGGGAPSPYAISPTYSGQSVPHLGQPLTTVTSSTIPTNLVPYTSTTTEAGIELRMFNSRFGIDLTVYDRTTTDDIVNASIAPSSSYANVALNVGKMTNKGVELMLTGDPIVSENGINWGLTLNGAYNENTVVKIADGLTTLQLPGATTRTLNGGIYHFEGEPFGMIAGNRMLTNDNGQVVYNSLSGIPFASPTESLGRGVPPLAIGFNNTFSYKNVNLSFLLDSRWGGSIYSATSAYGTDFGLDSRTVDNNVRETGVSVSGVDENGDSYSATVPAQTYYRGIAYSITEEFVQKADFIKLRSFSLGYNFPSSLIDRTPFTNASISVVGRNLMILYSTTDNIDPESNYSSSNAQGLENFGLPTSRSFGVDLNLSF